jgi:hypothetical protein
LKIGTVTKKAKDTLTMTTYVSSKQIYHEYDILYTKRYNTLVAYRSYLKTEVPAKKWAKKDSTKEEIDKHFQYMMDNFEWFISYSGYRGFENIRSIKRHLPDNLPVHLTRLEDEMGKLYIPYFVELIDYIGLYCWKHNKNITADEYSYDAPQLLGLIAEIIELMQLPSIFTFAKLVRMHHPIALSTIISFYNASVTPIQSDLSIQTDEPGSSNTEQTPQ